ncbi:MAG TPA: methyltransferase domain-containing protein [Casimicrobiaceae bacterium]|nr:methyltransferase domain-containing protein [Casimicrobiaceae bacterium]
MTWSPQRYLEFADLRLRPAVDLLARVPARAPSMVADLGCGAGNVTRLLAERWPEADIVGVDSSPTMLARARVALADAPRVRFEERDLATWAPSAPVDVVYSNAALHWLDDHATLIPRLAGTLAQGGALAIQMPSNFGTPSHATIAALARSERWRGRVGDLVRDEPVAPPEQYLRWLAPRCASVDVWETVYLQRLAARDDGEHPVVAFVSDLARSISGASRGRPGRPRSVPRRLSRAHHARLSSGERRRDALSVPAGVHRRDALSATATRIGQATCPPPRDAATSRQRARFAGFSRRCVPAGEAIPPEASVR